MNSRFGDNDNVFMLGRFSSLVITQFLLVRQARVFLRIVLHGLLLILTYLSSYLLCLVLLWQIHELASVKLKPSVGSASKKPQSRKSSGKSTGKFCTGFSSLTRLQLFRGRLSEKNVHATSSKGNMGYAQYNVPDTVAVEPTFVAFLQHSKTYVHGLSCHSFKFL